MKNIILPIVLSLLVAFSLVFNHNGLLWANEENSYYQLFGILLVSGILFFIGTRKIVFNRVDVLITLLLACLGISRFLRLGSINEIHVITTFSLLIYYIVLKQINLKDRQKNVYQSLIIITTVFLCVFCFFEFFYIVEPLNLQWRITGNFSNPGPLGGFVAIILPYTFNGVINSYKRERYLLIIIYFIAILLMSSIIILSESRAAMGAAFIGLIIVIYYNVYKKQKFFKYILLLAAPILIGIIYSKGMDSIKGRFFIWKVSLQSFLEKPFFGIGYNFFEVNYLNVQSQYFLNGGTTEEILLADYNRYAFNESLKFLVENGILGIIFISICFLWILKSKNNNQKKYLNNYFITSIALYSSFFFFSSFSYPLHFLPFKLILLNHIALQKHKIPFFVFSFNKRSFMFSLSIPLCYFLSVGVYQYSGIKAWNKAFVLQYKDASKTSKLYLYASKRLLLNGKFLFYYGRHNESKEPLKALNLYKKAEKLYNTPLLHTKMAKLYENSEKFNEAEKEYEIVHYMKPHLFKPQEELLDFYIRRKKMLKAKYYTRKIINTPIKIDNKEIYRIKKKAKVISNMLISH